MIRLFSLLSCFFTSNTCSTAWADHAKPWQMNFQEPASPVMQQIYDLHTTFLYIIGIIAFLVIGTILGVVFRFRASKHPVPSKVSHHTWLEIVWTAIPAVIVAVMLVPSLKLLYFMEKSPPAQVTIKATGHQWYWSYDYPDAGISFDSILREGKDLQPNDLRLLEVDRRIILPVGVVVKVLLTSVDVLHSWAVPALGIKTDCVPGRLNETWLQITKEGVYYGQCSELCGSRHGFMPIVIEAVSPERYQQWLLEAKTKLAYNTNHLPVWR